MKNNNFNKIKIMIILIYLIFLNFEIKIHLYINHKSLNISNFNL